MKIFLHILKNFSCFNCNVNSFLNGTGQKNWIILFSIIIFENIYEKIEARIFRKFADADSVVDECFDLSADDKSNQNKLDVLKDFTTYSTMMCRIWNFIPRVDQSFVVTLVVSNFNDALQIDSF